MKNILIVVGIILAVILIIVTVFLILSNLEPRERAPDAEPYIRGYVFAIEQDTFLVAHDIEGDELYEGDDDRLIGEAVYFTVTDETKFIDPQGENEDYLDLSVYDEVEVWSTEMVRESYPAQAEAVRVERTGRTYGTETVDEDPAVSASCDHNNAARLRVLRALEDNWSDLEQDIPARPAGGSVAWHKPYHAQFIGNDAMMIAFEDGHAVVVSVVGFTCEDGEVQDDFFVIDEESVHDFPMSEDEWSGLRVNFGDFRHAPNTYTSISVYAEGVRIEAQDWREIDVNIFIATVGHSPKD